MLKGAAFHIYSFLIVMLFALVYINSSHAGRISFYGLITNPGCSTGFSAGRQIALSCQDNPATPDEIHFSLRKEAQKAFKGMDVAIKDIGSDTSKKIVTMNYY